MDKLFETINEEFKAQGPNLQVLPNFGICCRELARLKVTSLRACVRSFCSVIASNFDEGLCFERLEDEEILQNHLLLRNDTTCLNQPNLVFQGDILFRGRGVTSMGG